MRRFVGIVLCLAMVGLFGCSNQNDSDLLSEIERLKNEIESLEQGEKEIINDVDTDVIDNQEIADSGANEQLIWELVQLEVAKNLNQPSTAEFEDISKAMFYKITNDTYEVLGYAGGQNLLGNVVWNYFYATVILDSTGQPSVVSDIGFLGDSAYEERVKLNERLVERRENNQPYLTAEELTLALMEQPLHVTNTKFLDSDYFRASSSSMLQAVLYNNSETPIKSANIAFVAWDKNKLPIKIMRWASISDGSYFSRVNYSTLNLMPGDTFGGKTGNTYHGMEVDEILDVSYLKAIVVSYEDFDGNTWENPLLLDFRNLYEGKRLLE